MSDTPTSLRARNRAVWSSGDWDVMATYIAPAGPQLLDRLTVGPGTRLLDVGTGSGGSVAIPAAQRGATVIGSDITDAWFPAARHRAAQVGVDVQWVVGDAAELPFGDDTFDVVTSTRSRRIGRRAGPRLPSRRHRRAVLLDARRQVRADVRPTWQSHAAAAQGLSAPSPVGRRAARARIARAARLRPRTASRAHRRDLPLAPGAAETMEHNFGPMVTAKAMLGDRWPTVRADLDVLMAEMNEAHDGTMMSTNEYLQIIGRLAG
jgi:SAM-dependent methyltransferase